MNSYRRSCLTFRDHFHFLPNPRYLHTNPRTRTESDDPFKAYSPLQPNPEFDPQQNPQTSTRRKPKWLIQKEALRGSFPKGWNPPKKISRPAMSLLRSLHKEDPHQFSLPVLADRFKISPEAVRRILKSSWLPNDFTTDKMMKKSEMTVGSESDAWIRHEKLETDAIPSNLASTLRNDQRSLGKDALEVDWSDGTDSDGIWEDPEIKSRSSQGMRREKFESTPRTFTEAPRRSFPSRDRSSVRNHRQSRHASPSLHDSQEFSSTRPSPTFSTALGSAFESFDRPASSIIHREPRRPRDPSRSSSRFGGHRQPRPSP